MKKIFLTLTLGLLLSGCIKKNEEIKVEKPPVEEKTIFSTIKEAVEKSIGLECTYVDEDGERMTVDLMGNRFLIKYETEDEQKTRMMAKDNKMWLWSEVSKSGFIVDFSKVVNDEKSSLSMRGKPLNSLDDIVAILEEEKQNCKTKAIDESAFMIPTGINFDE